MSGGTRSKPKHRSWAPRSIRDLLETLTFITEYPTAIRGDFDPAYLELPAEVLTTVMRHHQKYFSVDGVNGGLAPNFVAVMNTSGDPEGIVKHGNERVLQGPLQRRPLLLERRSAEEAGRSRRRSGARHFPGQARVVSGENQSRGRTGQGAGRRRPRPARGRAVASAT